MRKKIPSWPLLLAIPISFICRCHENSNSVSNKTQTVKYGGYADQVSFGRHIVQMSGCNDCHTPKKMKAMGPISDTSLLLSGHPAALPAPDINRSELEKKGLAVTGDMTAWAGPWGVSYSANLTPDETGIGNWNEEQFVRAIREGKAKGLQNGRIMLPPMPWQQFSAYMTDEEIKAIFAYLKSIRPVNNIVPRPLSPVMNTGGIPSGTKLH
jgi:mono/diheme cytochrome c family protein